MPRQDQKKTDCLPKFVVKEIAFPRLLVDNAASSTNEEGTKKLIVMRSPLPIKSKSRHRSEDGFVDTIEELEINFGFGRIARWVAERASSGDDTLRKGLSGKKLVTSEKVRRKSFPALDAGQLYAIERRAREKPWEKRQQWRMSPFEWVGINYSEWLGRGLTQSHLQVDPSLYQALRRWRMKHGRPANIDLPANEREPIESPKEESPDDPETLGRLLLAAGHKVRRLSLK